MNEITVTHSVTPIHYSYILNVINVQITFNFLYLIRFTTSSHFFFLKTRFKFQFQDYNEYTSSKRDNSKHAHYNIYAKWRLISSFAAVKGIAFIYYNLNEGYDQNKLLYFNILSN